MIISNPCQTGPRLSNSKNEQLGVLQLQRQLCELQPLLVLWLHPSIAEASKMQEGGGAVVLISWRLLFLILSSTNPSCLLR